MRSFAHRRYLPFGLLSFPYALVDQSVKHNTRVWRAIVPIVLTGLLATENLWARDWQVNYNESKVGFVATYDEIPFEGRFENFQAIVRFDPLALDQSSFKVDVAIASVNTDSPDRDEGMLEQDFFDVSQYPSSTFTSTAFAKLPNTENYEVKGDLTIKGISKPISLVFTWQASDTNMRLQGQGNVKRTDFKVGMGDWEEDDTIGFDVQVMFDLSLH